MNYEMINRLSIEKHISIASLAERIGMSKPGLYLSIKRKTLTVESLEKISDVFNVPVARFFDEQPEKEVQDDKLKKLENEVRNLKTELLNSYRLYIDNCHMFSNPPARNNNNFPL